MEWTARLRVSCQMSNSAHLGKPCLVQSLGATRSLSIPYFTIFSIPILLPSVSASMAGQIMDETEGTQPTGGGRLRWMRRSRAPPPGLPMLDVNLRPRMRCWRDRWADDEHTIRQYSLELSMHRFQSAHPALERYMRAGRWWWLSFASWQRPKDQLISLAW